KLYGLKIPYKDEENEKQPEPRPVTEPAPEPVVSDQPQPPVQTAAAPARKPSQKGYVYPPLNLLKKPDGTKGQTGQVQIGEMSRILENTLRSFGVNASVINVVQGPAVTRFDVQPATGVKVSSIVKLKDDIALNLRARSLRIEAPIPGQAAVGIEVANENVNTVLLREIIDTKEFKNHKSKVAIALGRAISGDPIIANIKDMPHLLIAGTTGSGKSVCINDILISLLYKASPEEVKLLLIDPKVVELSNFNGIPHLLAPVVTEPNKASAILAWAVSEMNERYQRFASEGVREIESYNETVIANEEPEKALPKIVIVIDELADLIMMSKNAVESNICMLAQKARAAGMYLIIATQRPSTNVITGVIKANIPSKIAFAVNSHIDSQVILDMTGAESLLGRGDMLYLPQSMGKPVRVQGCYVSDQEVNAVIDFVKSHNTAQNDFSEDAMAAIERAGSAAAGDEESDEADDLLAQCIEFAVTNETCSVSILQRKFRIGYNRAARLVDMMEERGILGPADGQKPRKVLLNAEEFARLKRAAESAAMDESES
ncbi:MAG: DNA translocase FtsK, partial [Firmicutes bacterium]|nr:DNA translocase FtsK [Bacillota bacterium]